MIRQKISSNLDSMQALHIQHGWIPGCESIRPDDTLKEKKKNYITNMLTRYGSLDDFVLHRFFGLQTVTKGGWTDSKLYTSDSAISSTRRIPNSCNGHEFRLVPNMFHYKVPVGTNHYVIWFLLNGDEIIDSTTHSPISEDEINSSIEQALRQLLGPKDDRFSFVWYPNPKPTIVSSVLFHVQVFWIPSQNMTNK